MSRIELPPDEPKVLSFLTHPLLLLLYLAAIPPWEHYDEPTLSWPKNVIRLGICRSARIAQKDYPSSRVGL
ncbi:MAG: hypothetical protein JXM73_23290 [Anaerolineae bacterium]|nr:hypothetical protein [Anaerolineae bacterium]